MKLLILISISIIFSVHASDGIYNQTLTVDGQYSQKRLSASDRMKILRKKLEKQTEAMVSKKLETLRLQQEILMNKKIMKAMNNSSLE